jgi:hypothetical protein
MPKATAVWLVENTSLTFDQIADFCGLHALEVQGIADGEVAIGMVGLDPIGNGQLSKDEIERCQADPKARLVLRKPAVELPSKRNKGPRYTPVARRQDKPDAIAWLLKHAAALSDAQVAKLIGTTKNTINAVRDRTHWNAPNIKARHPVALGLCAQKDLNEAMEKAEAREESRRKREAKGTEAPAAAAAPQKSTPDYPDATEVLLQEEPEVPEEAADEAADVFSAFKPTPEEKKPEDEGSVNPGSVWPGGDDAKPSDS